MSDANRPDPVTVHWEDYLREIRPDARASMRVRRGLDRALAERRRAAPTDAPTQPMPRAAAAFFVIKSSALSVGLALATLGGLHVGARALAPAELPPVVEPAAPSRVTQEPRATAEPRRSPASPELPSVASVPSEVPVVAPVRAPTRAPTDATHHANTKRSAPPTPAPPPVAPDDLRAELALMDRAKTALAAGDDAQVLRLVREHAERFPAGSMIEERRGWTVIARCREGAATARSIAESFARDYPRSVLLDDIHHACSQHSSTDSPRTSE